MGLFDNKEKQYNDNYRNTWKSINFDNIPESEIHRLEDAVRHYSEALRSKYAEECTMNLSLAAVEQNFVMINLLSEILGKLKEQ